MTRDAGQGQCKAWLPAALMPAILLSCAMACGCSAPAGSAEPAVQVRREPVIVAGDEMADMVGTWRLESVDSAEGSGDTTFFTRGDVAELEAMGLGGTLRLDPDGTAAYDVIGKAGSGTWDGSFLVTSDGRRLPMSLGLGRRLCVSDGNLTYRFSRLA